MVYLMKYMLIQSDLSELKNNMIGLLIKEMKTTIFIISIALLSSTCLGQVLNPATNILRPGDRLTEQRIVFQDLGRSGENVLWNLGDVEVVDGRYKLRYAAVNDSLHDWIAGTEHRTMYYYDQSAGDGIRIA